MFKSNPFHRRRQPYMADNTTWTCNSCGTQAWTDGKNSGCSCPKNGQPRPLVADDPNHWSNRELPHSARITVGNDEGDNLPRRDPRDDLVEVMSEQVAVLNDIIATQGRITSAARHLMNVFAQRSASGTPIFKLNEEGDLPSAEILRHAILDLQALLDGTETPHFCLPTERTH